MKNDIPSLGFVLWSSAKDNPPASRFKELEPVLMEVDGEAIPGWWNNRDWFDWECSADSPDLPDRWAAMPSPPDTNDPLTVERLLALVDSLPQHALYDIERDESGNVVSQDTEVGRTAARLRRALDAIGTH